MVAATGSNQTAKARSTATAFSFNASTNVLSSNSLNITGVSTFLGFYSDNQLITGNYTLNPDDIVYSMHKTIIVSTGSTFTVGSGKTFIFSTYGKDTYTGDIYADNGYFSRNVTAQDFNSLSDLNFKENVKTIESPLKTVLQLRGVSFDWKNNGKSSMGLIAQELNDIIPELVTDTNPKTVNYNGLIGLLIEAVKELNEKIDKMD